MAKYSDVSGDVNNTLLRKDGKIIGHYLKEEDGLKKLGTNAI